MRRAERATAAPPGPLAAPAPLTGQEAGPTPIETVPSYRLENQVGFILRQVQQRHALIFSAAFGEAATTMQWAVLAKLAEIGECSQNLLGRLVAMDVATIKGVVERLGKRGLVEFRPDPADRRRILVTATALGTQVYLAQAARALAVSDETLAPLRPAERATLLGLLDRLR